MKPRTEYELPSVTGRVAAGRRRHRFGYAAGLSLLELLVVLTILIALGGIVVSTLPGLLDRTQIATAAANVPQIDSSIRQNMILHQGRLGDRFDSLISGSTSLDGQIPSYVGGDDVFQAGSLTEDELEALRAIGVTELIPAAETTNNATYESHQQAPVPLGTDSKVATINVAARPDLIRQLWNMEPNKEDKYLVFGLGARSTLVGSGQDALFAEAPVHFSDTQTTNPRLMYSRYLLVVALTHPSDQQTTARYLGTCIPGPRGLETISQALQEHYSNQD